MRCEEITTRPHQAQLACIVCGCTEDRACEGGCSWVSLNPPFCSACEELAADLDLMRLRQHTEPAESGLFGVQRCPASATPAPHAPLWIDDTSGYCARCHEGFTS